LLAKQRKSSHKQGVAVGKNPIPIEGAVLRQY